METVELDIRGQICPSCLLLALKEINQNSTRIKSGEMEVTIVTDDRQAISTIPEAAKKMGYDTQVEKLEKEYRIHVAY